MASLNAPPYSSLVFRTKEIDEPDEFERTASFHLQNLRSLLRGMSERDASATVQKIASESDAKYEELMNAIVYAMLTDRQNLPLWLRYLTSAVRDEYARVTRILQRFVELRFSKMLDEVKSHIVLILKEFIAGHVPQADGICYQLLRNVCGGDLSPRNVGFAQLMLDLLVEQKEWLIRYPDLTASVFYCFSRLSLDHLQPQFRELCQKEVSFVVSLLKEAFTSCMLMGRDAIRILVHTRIFPEIDSVYKTMMQHPGEMSEGWSGIESVLSKPTSMKFLLSRLSPEMERFLYFIMKQVSMGNQRRYQLWFTQKFLSSPESDSLVSDLLRYVCCVYHPSQETMQRGIVARWAILGWLLKSIKSKTDSVYYQVHLALFYDWFCFEPTADSFMNIEPIFLLQLYSIPKYPEITKSLLVFLLRSLKRLPFRDGDSAVSAVKTAFEVLERAGVGSVKHLIKHNRLDPSLREEFSELFPEILQDKKENGSKDSPNAKKNISSVVESPEKKTEHDAGDINSNRSADDEGKNTPNVSSSLSSNVNLASSEAESPSVVWSAILSRMEEIDHRSHIQDLCSTLEELLDTFVKSSGRLGLVKLTDDVESLANKLLDVFDPYFAASMSFDLDLRDGLTTENMAPIQQIILTILHRIESYGENFYTAPEFFLLENLSKSDIRVVSYMLMCSNEKNSAILRSLLEKSSSSVNKSDQGWLSYLLESLRVLALEIPFLFSIEFLRIRRTVRLISRVGQDDEIEMLRILFSMFDEQCFFRYMCGLSESQERLILSCDKNVYLNLAILSLSGVKMSEGEHSMFWKVISTEISYENQFPEDITSACFKALRSEEIELCKRDVEIMLNGIFVSCLNIPPTVEFIRSVLKAPKEAQEMCSSLFVHYATSDPQIVDSIEEALLEAANFTNRDEKKIVEHNISQFVRSLPSDISKKVLSNTSISHILRVEDTDLSESSRKRSRGQDDEDDTPEKRRRI